MADHTFSDRVIVLFASHFATVEASINGGNLNTITTADIIYERAKTLPEEH